MVGRQVLSEKHDRQQNEPMLQAFVLVYTKWGSFGLFADMNKMQEHKQVNTHDVEEPSRAVMQLSS